MNNSLLKYDDGIYKKDLGFFMALDKVSVSSVDVDYFQTVSAMLAEWMDVDCVFIGQVQEKLKTLAMYKDGEIVSDFEYDLNNRLLQLTRNNNEYYYAENIIHEFPKDNLAKEIKAKGYLGVLLYSDDGEVIGVLSVLSRNKIKISQDIINVIKSVGLRLSAEIKRRNIIKQLENAKEKYRKSNSLKNKLFSILTHDLKNSFNNIVMISDCMRFDAHAENHDQVLSQINMISESALRSSDLLNQLLDWSLSQMKGDEYKPREIVLSEICKDVIQMVQNMSKQKGVLLSYDVDEEIRIFADKNLVEIVIRNLIINAIKYTNEGGAINISALKADEPGFVEISINDNGVGIEEYRADNIFVADSVCSTPGTNNEPGTGLGLMLCKEFVEKHGGKIWVESKLGEGSSFKFTMPLVGSENLTSENVINFETARK